MNCFYYESKFKIKNSFFFFFFFWGGGGCEMGVGGGLWGKAGVSEFLLL